MWGVWGEDGGVHSPGAAVTQQLSHTGTLKLTGSLPPARSGASHRCNRSQRDARSDRLVFIAEEYVEKKHNNNKKKTSETRREVEPTGSQIRERRGKTRP